MIFRFFITFLILSVITALLFGMMGISFGRDNYWNNHGIFLLLFLALFPRLTLLFSSIPFGGVLWWISFIFCPRYLIAVLATMAYWHQNPILVTISWLVAIGGESSEKYIIKKSVVQRGREEVIDAEFIEISSKKLP